MNIQIPKITHPFNRVGQKIESKTRKALYEFEMLKNVKSLAIALSGGKDSLCMLYMLKAITENGFDKTDLLAIHIDGDFSCGASFEKRFLQNLCDEIGIKLYFKSLKINLKKTNCYSCSRNRRRLIFEIAKENNINTIAFGHHLDDNIETLFLNLLHKAEFEPMMPKIKMHAYDVYIIRPLIFVAEDEILKFAKSYNILKTFCKCPIGQTSKRKDVKKIILDMEKTFPSTKSNLSKASFIYGLKKALLK